MSLVTYELDNHIATITLNRPEARNAINGALRTELNAAWERFRGDEDAWVGSSPPTATSSAPAVISRTARAR